ncbi:hypothetical protein F4810DRAFT_599737 [Camillea tinctor]|nr:hypothetical protein F4810DRAFT_599737 [Camillea tinctor]
MSRLAAIPLLALKLALSRTYIHIPETPTDMGKATTTIYKIRALPLITQNHSLDSPFFFSSRHQRTAHPWCLG